jgi:hypothetical protein
MLGFLGFLAVSLFIGCSFAGVFSLICYVAWHLDDKEDS